MTHTPPTGQQLDEIEARAARLHEYVAVDVAGAQPDFDKLTGEDVPALLAALRDSRTELERERENYQAYRIGAEGAKAIAARRIEQLDRALSETIDDRDQAHETLDKLAYAVAPSEVIGEHSSMNCPWTNALDLITPAAKVADLHAEIEKLARWHREDETALADMRATIERLRADLAARAAAVAAVAETGQ